MLHLCDTFLLAVQSTSCSLFLRQEDRLQPGRTVKWPGKRVLAANICEVAGELCLYLLSSGTSGPAFDFWALPSLQQVASVPVSQMVADAADSAVIASDGSLVIRSKSGGLWFSRASDTSESVALESSVRAATLAQIIQSLQKSVSGLWKSEINGVLFLCVLRGSFFGYSHQELPLPFCLLPSI